MSRVSPIPSEAYKALWECILKKTNQMLLEGFAGARRCTNEGRSLMQLDYQVIKVENNFKVLCCIRRIILHCTC